jgi:hypothetical protein
MTRNEEIRIRVAGLRQWRMERLLERLAAFGAAMAAVLAFLIAAPVAHAGFGFSAVDGQVTDASGNPYTQAGGHPAAISVQVELNHHLDTDPSDPFVGFGGGQVPDGGNPKDVLSALPPGLIGNPTAVPKCTASELAGGGPANALNLGTAPTCPVDSQVGVLTLETSESNPFNFLFYGTFALYNMAARPSVPGSFGFQAAGTPVILDASLRSDGDYGLTIASRNIPETFRLWGVTATFWGVPADPSHDADRCSFPGACSNPVAAGLPAAAFLRLPTRCTPSNVGLQTTFSVDSWENPGTFASASFFSHLPPNFPDPAAPGPQQGPTRCDLVPFDPTLTATPVSPAKAASPSGFQFELKLPQSNDPNGISEGDLRKAVVTLPAGVRVSPSSADGRAACSSAQIGLIGTGFADPNPIRFTTADPTCPDAAKLGTVTLTTPLLEQPLTGTVYLAAPFDNPFHTLLAIYIVVKGHGVILKLPGKVSADPATGQLTTTFDDNPQLPFSDLTLDFNGGPRAALVTPPTCGDYTTHSVLTSWSGAQATSDSTFTIDHGPNGAPCNPPGFSPAFKAGPLSQVAGADTGLGVQITRGDSDQELRSVAVDTPSGLLGRIANVVLCPDGPANAGSCTDGSQIGSVAVSAGASSDPFSIRNGRAYLTGPYHGAPFGLSMVVPAVAGPFDLGNVVVRARILVNPRTAALKVISDPLPAILQGIPLDVRKVQVKVDRPHFIVNPTSCALKQTFGTMTSVAGAIAHGSWRFSLVGCDALPLAPQMALTVGGRGHTGAGVPTSLTATLRQTPGQSNLRAVSVTLPSTLNALLGGALGHACSRAQFDAGQCGAAARAGSAVAITPLLRDPLRGIAYFVKGSRTLPDLVVALRGQVDVELVGKTGVDPATNRLTTRFDTIPDAPITKFTLRLSASNGAVGTTTNLCSAKARRATATIGFRGQNGARLRVSQRLRVTGCPRGG